ncbi:CmpA/NrtA family ABC transporter substrate-binding protein [Magnetovibrio sp.]|uniref:CmpA/NrtA family ABC transporter substrate-binding protein n=1 Tax=Magnetovibrio sp. TaxID=2024836 RepID=UPI002F9452BC
MSTTQNLVPVRAGFIPLVDCAVLVVAREQGFAAQHGLDLQLFKEVSWANIRDRVNVGQFDVAHMLAGMPIAASLGVGHIKVATIAPMALSVGGNAITVSHGLFDELNATGLDLSEPLSAAKALRQVVDRRRGENREPLSFGQVFPFSCHNYQLRYWMAAAGIDPERDVRLVVIPPPYMVKSLEAGQVDGFCVGEPWNTLAAEQGVGVILTHTAAFWPFGPEKVLGLQQNWAEQNSEPLTALLQALDQAGQWADDPTHRLELATLLARPEYLDVPQSVVLTALNGDLSFHDNGAARADCEHALWLYAQMVRWGQTPLSRDAEQAVCRTYRPDLLAEALGIAAGEQSERDTVFLDGVPFDATNVPGYIAALKVKS